MKLGMIGCGNMGTALLQGMLSGSFLKANEIFVYDISKEKVTALVEKWGVLAAQSGKEVADNSDVVILAVKPQYIESVAKKFAKFQDLIVVSIAAGVTLKRIRDYLDDKVALVRVMPNTPALVGEGASALYFDEVFKKRFSAYKQDILDLFNLLGLAVEVHSEFLLDVVTGLSGSGPAYVMTFINALADGAVKEGLDRKTARLLATQTVLGSALLVKKGLEDSEHPIELRDRVTSPGGTTAAGLFALEVGNFQATVQRAVGAATLRSRELGEK